MGEWISQGGARLRSAGVSFADERQHARDLVCGVLGWESSRAIAELGTSLDPTARERLDSALERRLQGEPLQYILGRTGFWKRSFRVGPGVLVPRPQTEHLVETALRCLPQRPLKIAELGPGSGAIGISLLLERPQWSWYAYEIDPQAAPHLRENLQLLPESNGYRWQQGDFFSLAPLDSPFDWIVANPPYIESGAIDQLKPEVRAEPRVALDGGDTGLKCIEKIVLESKKLLRPGGGVVLEIGCDQGERVGAQLRTQGFSDVMVERDLAGLDRVAFGRLSK